MAGLKLNPEYAQALDKTLALLGDKPTVQPRVGDVATRRTSMKQTWSTLMSQIQPASDVEQTHVDDIESYNGAKVPLHKFAKKTASNASPGPAILYAHGGGFFGLGVEAYSPLLSTYASTSGVPIFAIDYRLCPENRFPAPLEDCYSGLRYLHDNAASLGIDPARIAIMGDGAGGGLAAGVAILARNREVPLAKQLLLHPILDDRTVNPRTMPELGQFVNWSLFDNITAWDAYLEPGHEFKKYIAPPAAPARLENVAELAPLYLDVPMLDILRAEGVEYAGRCAKSAVDTEMHVYPGVPQGFEVYCPGIELAKMAMGNRVKAMRSF